MHMKRNMRDQNHHLGKWKTTEWNERTTKQTNKMRRLWVLRALCVCFSWHRLCLALLTQLMRIVFVWSLRIFSVYSINSAIFICKLFHNRGTFQTNHACALSSRPFVYLITSFFSVSFSHFLSISIFLWNLHFLTLFFNYIVVVVACLLW